MIVQVQSDLALLVQTMVDLNGLDTEKYVNGLIEKGIIADLQTAYKLDSVHEFWIDLITNKKPDWTILIPNYEH